MMMVSGRMVADDDDDDDDDWIFASRFERFEP
jgi:hypothetical protein